MLKLKVNKNFGKYLSRTGASINETKEKSKKNTKEEKRAQDELLRYADNPDLVLHETESTIETLEFGYSQKDECAKSLCLEYKDEMMFMLESGLNLAIYGVGSKINFLKHFTQNLKGHSIICGNGYHPGLTLKSALRELTIYVNDHYLKNKETKIKELYKFFSMHDNIEYLLKTLSVENLNISKIYLVLLSIDCGNLKSLELQKHLSTLAK